MSDYEAEAREIVERYFPNPLPPGAIWRDAPIQAAAAIAAAIREAVGGWLPMETAPRDGTEFQAWNALDFWEPRCRFNNGIEVWDDGEWISGHIVLFGWKPKPSSPIRALAGKE